VKRGGIVGSTVDKLISRELITPPPFLKNSIQYECIIGSVAYGISSGTSDVDLCGFCIPSKEIIFPHLTGVILGFDNDYKRFDQYQEHHIKDKGPKKEYDITIYNIVKYFRLCADGNPNMIDSLFVPRRCVLHSTQIGEMVREKRKLFLSKKCWHTHKGYAYSTLAKLQSKQNLGIKIYNFEKEHGGNCTYSYGDDLSFIKNDSDRAYYGHLLKELSETKSTRHEITRKFGFDVKFGFHVVRLLNQAEQILTEHDLDLEKNREQLKSIRRGEWTKEQIQDYFTQKEKQLEEVYLKSDLRHKPAIKEIKELLLNCLEQYFGSLDKMVRVEKGNKLLLNEIQDVLDKYR